MSAIEIFSKLFHLLIYGEKLLAFCGKINSIKFSPMQPYLGCKGRFVAGMSKLPATENGHIIYMKLKRYMIIILTLIGLIAVILIVGKINLSNQFSKEVKELFAELIRCRTRLLTPKCSWSYPSLLNATLIMF